PDGGAKERSAERRPSSSGSRRSVGPSARGSPIPRPRGRPVLADRRGATRLLPEVARRLPRREDPPLAGGTSPPLVTLPVTEPDDPFRTGRWFCAPRPPTASHGPTLGTCLIGVADVRDVAPALSYTLPDASRRPRNASPHMQHRDPSPPPGDRARRRSLFGGRPETTPPPVTAGLSP